MSSQTEEDSPIMSELTKMLDNPNFFPEPSEFSKRKKLKMKTNPSKIQDAGALL